MKFRWITLKSFAPFAAGMIEFPEIVQQGVAETHLITGQNGCGKTRLLCALAAASGNRSELDSRVESETDCDFSAAGADDLRVGFFVLSQNRALAFDRGHKGCLALHPEMCLG